MIGLSSACTFLEEIVRLLKFLTRLTAACADFGLHLLTKSSRDAEHVFPFGGGLSGHHGKVGSYFVSFRRDIHTIQVTDMTFCGGPGEDSARYVATVSGNVLVVIHILVPLLILNDQTIKCSWFGTFILP